MHETGGGRDVFGFDTMIDNVESVYFALLYALQSVLFDN